MHGRAHSTHNVSKIRFIEFRYMLYLNKACQVVLAEGGAVCLAGSLPGTLLMLFFSTRKNRGQPHLLLKATSPSPAATANKSVRAVRFSRCHTCQLRTLRSASNCDSALRVKYMYVKSLYLRCMEMDACDATRGTHATREG